MILDLNKTIPGAGLLGKVISHFLNLWGLGGELTKGLYVKFSPASCQEHEEQAASKDGPEQEFYLFLNKSVCNAHCIFCSRGRDEWQEKVRQEIKGFDYDAELRSIENKLKEFQLKQVFHLGGHEPSIYPTLLPIVSAAANAGFRQIVMETNGIALADSVLVDELVSAGLTEVRLAVYGITSHVHDSITGVDGSYLLLQQAVSNLRKRRVRIRLKTVVLRQNLHEMGELLSRDRKMGCGLVMPSSPDLKEYERLCPKLSSIPPEILDRIGDLYLPCVMPKRKNGVEPSSQDREGFAVLKNGHVIRQGDNGYMSLEQQLQQKIFLDRCSECSMRKKCTGIYTMYWELFGKKELGETP